MTDIIIQFIMLFVVVFILVARPGEVLTTDYTVRQFSPVIPDLGPPKGSPDKPEVL